MVIDLGPAVGEEAHGAVGDALLRGFDAGVLEEPLLGEAGFDGDVGAFGEADVVDVGFGLLEGAGGFHEFGGLLAGGEAVETGEFGAGFSGHLAVGREDVDDRELVAEADLEVGLVVGRGDLEDAGTELEVDVVIGDDGNDALFLRDVERERLVDVLADEVLVARVLGVDGDGGVRGDGLRAGGGDGEEGARFFHDLDAEVVHEPALLLHGDLLVGEGGQGGGAPVHHALAAVDEALLVKVHEHALDAPGVFRVHGEAGAGPVAGGAERAELLEDDAAVLLLPFPDPGDEGLASEVVAVLDLAGLLEGLLDDVLGGDAGVVGAGQPEDLLAVHARLAGEDVLDGVVQDVAEGQYAGDVGRRDDDGIGGARSGDAGGVCREAALLHPEVIPLRFDGLWLVGLGDLGHDAAPDPAPTRHSVASAQFRGKFEVSRFKFEGPAGWGHPAFSN